MTSLDKFYRLKWKEYQELLPCLIEHFGVDKIVEAVYEQKTELELLAEEATKQEWEDYGVEPRSGENIPNLGKHSAEAKQ